MGIETRRAVLGARTKKNLPPILSHEFIIKNHGDIISCVIMVIMLGFMFQISTPIAKLFIVPQYNDTVTLPKETEPKILYHSGILDIPSIFFYALAWIAVHCALHEYFLEKIQRRLHLSKTRQTKFNESGQLVAFAAYSLVHSSYILHELGIQHDITQLWNGYPETHRHYNLSTKLFFIFQISYWIHQFPEFYFQKLKKEEIRSRIVYCVLFLAFVTIAYFANFTRFGLAILFLEYISQTIFHFTRLVYFTGKIQKAGKAFKPWNAIFVIIRFAIILISVLTQWYGMRSLETPYINYATGNFNTNIIRLNILLITVSVQLYMLYNFCTFHLASYREKVRENGQDKQVYKRKTYKKLKAEEKNNSENLLNDSKKHK